MLSHSARPGCVPLPSDYESEGVNRSGFTFYTKHSKPEETSIAVGHTVGELVNVLKNVDPSTPIVMENDTPKDYAVNPLVTVFSRRCEPNDGLSYWPGSPTVPCIVLVPTKSSTVETPEGMKSPFTGTATYQSETQTKSVETPKSGKSSWWW